MNAQALCPEPALLKELLSGSLPETAQVQLTSHLETCPNCQQKLEELSAEVELSPSLAQGLGRGRPVAEPDLRRALDELQEEPTKEPTRAGPAGREEFPLDFLSPSEKPGHLGKLGHYEVTEFIGRGGMGIVLKAFDEKLHRVVAIKVMAPELAANATARKRFVREAQAAAAIRNDHVIDIYAVEDAPSPYPLPRGGEGSGLPYLVMEYISGKSLQDRLDESGPLELREILRIGMQTANGLAAAHAQGLIHRDIKPANILMENGVERVKITDFGLARAVDDASISQSGIVAGTPQFMAPEQARGEHLDHRADLFSLGSMLYAMCTGRAPFRAANTVAVLRRVSDDQTRPIREINPDIPDWLVAIVDKLHAKEPEDRYQTAAEVAELLSGRLAQLQQPIPTRSAELGARNEESPKPARNAELGARNEESTQQPLPSNSAFRTPRSTLDVPSHSALRAPRSALKWAAAAAVVLVLIGSLAVTEATGVTKITDFVATTLRITTPEGTLIVEVDDPNVKITIEGDGGLVITGAGPQEVRLKPGSYKVEASKDGKPVKSEVVTITRNGKKVVTVHIEGSRAGTAGQAEKQAFVLLGGKGVPERKFDTLVEAVQVASNGDVIEVRGNGPFVTPTVSLGNRALTLRAAPGFHPVIRLNREGTGAGAPLLTTNSSLVLEGLELGLTDDGVSHTGWVSRVMAGGPSVSAANCRFQNCHFGITSRNCRFRNCEFVTGVGAGVFWWYPNDGELAFDNCVMAGGGLLVFFQHRPLTKPPPQVHVAHCTVRAGNVLTLEVQPGTMPLKTEAGTLVRLAVSESVIDVNRALRIQTKYDERAQLGQLAERIDSVLPNLLAWSDRQNLYAEDNLDSFVTVQAAEEIRPPSLRTLAGWDKAWGQSKTGSSRGRVRYQGGDPLAGKVTPEDFRLRPDSAGYRAGKDGKDLGADVDLVGPGAAYERWKKTPEYQQWLKDTGQLRAEAPKPEPKSFVVLGGKGVAERKFDTLAEVVQNASDGDTIEVRGNGPFVSQPVNIQRTALTIRAGDGYRPVLKLSPEGEQRDVALLTTNAALVLEGLELSPREDQKGRVLEANGAPLQAANCRFRAAIGVNHAPVCVFRNCEFLAEDAQVAGTHRPGARVIFENCLHRTTGGAIGIVYDDAALRDVSIQIKGSTFVTRYTSLQLLLRVPLAPPSDPPPVSKAFRLEVSGSIFDTPTVLNFTQYRKLLDKAAVLGPAEAEATLLRLLEWRGERNLFAAGSTSVVWWADDAKQHPPHGPKSLGEWKRFWEGAEADSLEGAPRFQGGNLGSRPEAALGQLTPDDFRLRPDSAGYRAGKDGKDLGADVDLVGPGAAYERWKKMPEYQQWLKDTGQGK